MDDREFDLMLDEYQERERERAEERAVRADAQALRIGAIRGEITFGELVVGDYITAEDGPHARWVEVVKIERDARPYGRSDPAGWVKITFRTPEPLGVAYEDRYVMERTKDAAVTIDVAARA